MHKQRYGIIISALLGAAAVFLPWRVNPQTGETFMGIEGAGVITLVMCVLCILLGLKGSKSRKVYKWKLMGIITLGGSIITVGLFRYGQLVHIIEDEASTQPELSGGVGIWLSVLAGVLLMMIPIMLKDTPLVDKPQA